MIERILRSLRNFFPDARAALDRGLLLSRKLPDEIREAEAAKWESDLVNAIREDAGRYFGDLGSLLTRLAAVVSVALLVLIGLLFGEIVVGLLHFLYLVCLFFGIGTALALLWPAFALIPHLKKLPRDVYRELLWPLWVSTEVVNIVASIALLTYIFFGWHIAQVLTILVVLGAFWLLVPWVVYFLFEASAFVYLRISQFSLLVVAAFLSIASPVPMSQFQWAAQRSIAERIRPVEQQEITSRWQSLQWFTQEGSPMVWYSFAATSGYHLYASPGHDPQTNEELRPVADQATRNSIIKAFQTQLEAAAKQASLEADENAKTLAKEKQAHDDAMRAAAEQERKNHAIAADEAAAEEIHRFVYPSAGESKHHLSIVVLSADGSADQSISPKYAEMLRSSGLKCDGPIFTPEFTSSQGFQRLISNSREGVQTFRPENYVSYLLVVKESSPAQSHQTIAGTDMIVSDTNWTVDLIAVEDARTVRSWTISERGTGFSDAESAKLAITRAEQHLARLAPDIQAASM